MKNEKNLEVELKDVDVELSEEQKKRFEEDAQSRNRRIAFVQELRDIQDESAILKKLTEFQYMELYRVLEKINNTPEQENELMYWLKYSKHRAERP